MKLKYCPSCQDKEVIPEYGFTLKKVHSYNHISRKSFGRMKPLIHRGKKR